MVHRDIKPDNIVLAKSPNDPQATPSSSSYTATNSTGTTTASAGAAVAAAVPGAPAAGRALLVDFGGVQDALAAAHGADSGAAFGTTIVGTAGFTPPEQFGGGATPASDIYALGGVVLYLLSGKTPGAFGSARLRVAWEDAVQVCAWPHPASPDSNGCTSACTGAAAWWHPGTRFECALLFAAGMVCSSANILVKGADH